MTTGGVTMSRRRKNQRGRVGPPNGDAFLETCVYYSTSRLASLPRVVSVAPAIADQQMSEPLACATGGIERLGRQHENDLQCVVW
jgi:hypothetical protein